MHGTSKMPAMTYLQNVKNLFGFEKNDFVLSLLECFVRAPIIHHFGVVILSF